MAQPSTEELLADAQRLYSTLVDATVRLSAFTQMLRATLDQLDQLDPEEPDGHR